MTTPLRNYTCCLHRRLLHIFATLVLGISTPGFAQLTNGSFELPKLADGQTAEPFPIGYGWVANGGVGLLRVAAYYSANPYRVDPAMGRQWAALKAGTSLSQPVMLPAGVYYVSMNAMQSIGVASSLMLRVTLNGQQQVSVPQDVNNSALGVTAPKITLGPFSVSAGNHTLSIGADPALAGSIYVDNVVMYMQGINAPPSVAVVYPNAGQIIVNPTTELRATALDMDGTVSQVKFYDGTALLGIVNAPPWNLTINTASIATRTIAAKAFDGIIETTSDPVVFSHNTGGSPPYVTNGNFESPAFANGGFSSLNVNRWNSSNGAQITQGYTSYFGEIFSRPGEGRQAASFGISGYAGDAIEYYYLTLPAAGNYGMSFYASVPSGQTLKVSNSFTGNSFLLPAGTGRQTLPFTVSSPYLYFWPKFETQTGGLQLTTIDDVRIGPAGSPTVSITVPNNAQTFTAPTAITFIAALDSYDRNITEVEFFQSATSLGKSTVYPYSVTWVNVPPGTHTITAKVKDSLSAGLVSATSTPITVTVNTPGTAAFFNPGFEYRSYSGYSDFINASRPAQGWRGGGAVGYALIDARGYYNLGAPTAPEGATVAAVHPTSWIEQDVYFSSGNYQMRFKAGQTSAGGMSVQVRLNGTAVGPPFMPTTSYADYSSANFNVATAGLQTIRIESANTAATSYLALDDFRIIGAPTVTNSFSASSIVVNNTSTMTIAVTNPNAVALTGVAFTNAYPAGLTSSATPAATIGGGCSGTLIAAANGASFVLSAGFIPANTSCTYSVQVLATNAGIKTNSTGTITSANAPNGNAATATINAVSPITVPGAPLIGKATAGISQAKVSFIAPSTNGGSAITGYTATCGAQSGSGAGSPLTVTGLTNGTTVTCIVKAINAIGASAPSLASNSVIPATFPSAPTLIRVDLGNASAIVIFSAPTNDGGASISSYNAACGSQSASGKTSPITVSGLPIGKPVSCVVTALNIIGASPPSSMMYNVAPKALSATAPPLSPPVLSVTSPVNGSAFTSPAMIPINGTVSDADGTIVGFEFSANSIQISEGAGFLHFQPLGVIRPVVIGPGGVFSTIWDGAPNGDYSFVVATIDNHGNVSRSAPISIKVGGAPYIWLVGSDNDSIACTNAGPPVNLTAIARDINGAVGRVEFFRDGSLLGLGSDQGSGSYTYEMLTSVNYPPQPTGSPGYLLTGSMLITAKATNSNGLVTTSLSRLMCLWPPASTPPQLSASFSPSDIGANGTSKLMIAVNNNSETALNGVTFTNSYSAGLLNSAVPSPLVNGLGCSGNITASANGGNFSLIGGIVPPFTACTYSVQVKATALGTIVNAPLQITGTAGVIGTAPSITLTVHSLLDSLNGIKAALNADNMTAAKSYFKIGVRDTYAPILDKIKLRGATGFFDSLSSPQQSGSGQDFIEFAVSRIVGGQTYTFFIYYTMDEDGIWRIESM